ncbi:hypothetical protein [Oceanobacillus sp. CFH 90083]|uniref:hypothetical protein n=1 Tax=Oceanobacillus sp. CFH 90083 TaxID=2592336 RepID=UPI00128CE7A4|nr:hypothetical protein [Oceanobacillus sp. CFH 90083]
MKKNLLFLVMIFVLGACSNSNAVEADFEKLNYDFTEPGELDENDIILPGSTVMLEGEIKSKTEDAPDILASRISEQEDIKFENVAFEDSNLFMVETEEAPEYIVLVNNTDDFSEWNEGDFITVTGTFEGTNHQTFGPVIKADEIDRIDDEIPDN